MIAVELQGHGHTADIDRPFSYEQFADDVAAAMGHLDITQADIAGYSLGGNTGLQLAIRHPGQVRKLVAISANYRTDGYYPEVLALIQIITPDMFAGSPIEEAYLRHAPDPNAWSQLIEKEKQFEANAFAWQAEDLQSIAAPALLIIGDADGIRPEHAVEMLRLLGGGVAGDFAGLPPSQLAVLPGTTHLGVIFRTDWLVSMLTEFLNAPSPEERACATGPTARGRRRERRPAPCQYLMRRIGDGPSDPPR